MTDIRIPEHLSNTRSPNYHTHPESPPERFVDIKLPSNDLKTLQNNFKGHYMISTRISYKIGKVLYQCHTAKAPQPSGFHPSSVFERSNKITIDPQQQ